MVTKEEVEKIAKLSKLEFDEIELENIKKSMNDILEHIEILNEVDVENVEPLYNVNDTLNETLREDKVINTLKKEDFINNAPDKDENFIVIPKLV